MKDDRFKKGCEALKKGDVIAFGGWKFGKVVENMHPSDSVLVNPGYNPKLTIEVKYKNINDILIY